PGFERAAELLQVTLEVVQTGSSDLGRVPLIIDSGGPLRHTIRALLVQDRGRTDRVLTKDRREGRVALLLRQPTQTVLQLTGQALHADELALRVVDRDPQLVHKLGTLTGRVRQTKQHRP